ncbi:hypothetical protein BVC80_8917g22 [Macleaya cordata]|uniref:Uncharacterized protein n=1 Tax=Macleaya cordata TaxID=56857 RepID=A0A200QRT1_MACCD|nr:hypothetical protein BVC80_8917g22 [Macleaya cordata]
MKLEEIQETQPEFTNSDNSMCCSSNLTDSFLGLSLEEADDSFPVELQRMLKTLKDSENVFTQRVYKCQQNFTNFDLEIVICSDNLDEQ